MRFVGLFLSLAVLTGCKQAIQKAGREAGYSAYEMVGIEKRDLLKRRIDNVRDEQKEASETFKDSLDRLRKLYGLKGGALERQYNRIQSSYESSTEEAQQVRNSIEKMDTVAGDLFEEWER
jgi:hypothetical protein